MTRVVGAALLRDGRVLAAQRSEPARLAGLWEFPGGKVEPGESDVEALVRECVEELGVVVEVGPQVGPEIALSAGAVLVVFETSLLSGEPQAVEHLALRWLSADELDDVPWIPADAPVVEALRARLS